MSEVLKHKVQKTAIPLKKAKKTTGQNRNQKERQSERENEHKKAKFSNNLNATKKQRKLKMFKTKNGITENGKLFFKNCKDNFPIEQNLQFI